MKKHTTKRVLTVLVTSLMMLSAWTFAESGGVDAWADELPEEIVLPEAPLESEEAADVESYPEIKLGEKTLVGITEQGESAYFRFTPDKDGYYAFYSMSDDDTYGYILDSGMNELTWDDDAGDNLNFRIKYNMVAGETYILRAEFLSYDMTGSFNVVIEEQPSVTSVEIVTVPFRTTYVEGYIGDGLTLEGIDLKITWSDGQEIHWTYTDGWTVLGESIYTTIDEEQAKVYVGCMDQTDSYDVTLIENSVESIEVFSGAIELVEHTDGYWDTRYNEETGEYEEYFYYYINIPEDLIFQINYIDGTSDTMNCWDPLNGYQISWSQSQDVDPWTLGSDNHITFWYLGATVEVPVTIIENPVASIEVSSGAMAEIIEYSNGYWRERYNEETGEYEDYFRYYINVPSDLIFKINYKDGTSDTTSYWDSLNGYEMSYSNNQYNDPWTLGSDNYLTFEYLGATVEVPVTIVENPVASIEVASGAMPQIIEHTDGYWDTRYNNETGEYEDYFYYYINIPEDLIFKINYKDGTSDTMNCYEELNGYWMMSHSDNQYNDPWTLGSDNYLTFEYLDNTVEVPVTIVENPVANIEVSSGAMAEIIEHTKGYWDTRYNNETGEYEDYFYYYINIPSDLIFKINYKDGTSDTTSYWDSLNGYGMSCSNNQSSDPWTVGSDNYLTFEYLGATVEVPVTIVANPVASIEVSSGAMAEIIEHTDGYWRERYNEETGEYEDYFRYYINIPDDLIFKINYKDGTSDTTSYWDSLNGYGMSCSNNQSSDPWTVGSDNYLTFEYLGATVEVSVTIVESPVASIEVASGEMDELFEHANGYWDTRYIEETREFEDYFYYYFDVPYDLIFKINYKDGTSDTTSYHEMLNGYGMSCDNNQSSDPWTLGSDNYVTFEYLGVTVEVPVTIVENPVASIEVASGAMELVEHLDGYWDTRYNEETGEEEAYFYYYFDVPYDLIFKINYKDGTSDTMSYHEMLNGYGMSCDNNQSSDPWTLGSDNYVTFEYLGVTVEVPVTIIENPVASIEVSSGAMDEILEYSDGYWSERYNEETGEYEDYFRYYINIPDDLIFKINYKDGTSETFNYWNSEYGMSYDHNQSSDPWTVGSDNYLTFEYLGVTVEVPVTIVESPVASIEVSSGAMDELFEHANGYWDTRYNEETNDEEEYFYYYISIPDDLIFKVNYKDGTSETFNYWNSEYGMSCDTNQSDEPWTLGSDNYVTFRYLGATVEVPVTIVENPVAAIEIVKGPSLSNYEYGFEADFVGVEFKIIYTDGSEKLVTVDESNVDYDTEHGVYLWQYAWVDGQPAEFDTYRYNGAYYYEIEYMGQTAVGNCSYDSEYSIDEIEFSNISSDDGEMTVLIKHFDGTTTLLDLTPVTYNSYYYENGEYEISGINAAARTEKGMVPYMIEAYSINGVIQYYEIVIFEEWYTVEADLFDINFASMTLGNSLAMNFAFEKGHFDDWSGYYAEIIKTYADGRANAVEIVEFDEWKSATINGVAHYYVTFNGIAAKEMTDAVYVTIYNADGEAVSNVWVDSVRDYAMRNLAKAGISQEESIMTVDMLVYGAAAQKNFAYGENDLATSELTAEQLELATDTTEYKDTHTGNENYYASRLLLTSNIQLLFGFENIDPSMTAVVSFTNHYGVKKEITIPGSEFSLLGSVYAVTVSDMVVADGRQDITVEVYDGDTLVAKATDSVESYAARAAEAELVEAIMKLSDSAYNYFHR